MFKDIRHLSRTLEALEVAILKEAAEPDPDPRIAALEARLATLEASVAVTVGECRADLLKAESERKVARAAENRSYTLEAKRAAKEQDVFGDDEERQADIEEQYRDLVSDVDETANGTGGLQSLHEGLGVPRRLTRREQANQRMNRR